MAWKKWHLNRNYAHAHFRILSGKRTVHYSRGGSRFFVRRGCTRLLLYFKTNKPLIVYIFLQNLSCIRKPQVISGTRTPCTLPVDPPLYSKSENFRIQSDTCGRLKTIRIRCVWTRKFSHPQKNICGKKNFRMRVDVALNLKLIKVNLKLKRF